MPRTFVLIFCHVALALVVVVVVVVVVVAVVAFIAFCSCSFLVHLVFLLPQGLFLSF